MPMLTVAQPLELLLHLVELCAPRVGARQLLLEPRGHCAHAAEEEGAEHLYPDGYGGPDRGHQK